MTMTGSFSLLFLLFFKYGHGPIVSNPFASRVNIHLHCRCFVLYSGSSNVCDYHWCYDWLSSCCSCRSFDVCEGWYFVQGIQQLSLTPRQAQLLSQQAMLHKSGRLKLISKKQVPVPLPLIWAKGVISTTGSGSISATISSLPRAPATVASSTLSWLNVISLSMQLDKSSILISQITTTEIESDISPSPSSSSSGSDPSRTTSSSDLIVPPMISTMSSVGTDSDTLSPASTPIPSSFPSANLSSGNFIHNLSHKAKAILWFTGYFRIFENLIF